MEQMPGGGGRLLMNRTVLVTGAGGTGIGQATAVRCAQEGARGRALAVRSGPRMRWPRMASAPRCWMPHTPSPSTSRRSWPASATGAIPTVDEHNTVGGLGAAVAEVLGRHGVSARLGIVALPDEGQQVGVPADLLAHHGITAEGITALARALTAQ